MSLVNFIILLSIFHYGHCLTLTLEELENWKKLMKAELKQEIFLEITETEEIKRINQKIQEVTKGNEEIITVVQSHGITLDNFQETETIIENHSNLLNDLVAKQNETEGTIDELKNNQTESLDIVNNQISDLVNKQNETEVTIDELKNNQTESLDIVKNQVNDLENSCTGFGVNQTEELQQALGVSPQYISLLLLLLFTDTQSNNRYLIIFRI